MRQNLQPLKRTSLSRSMHHIVKQIMYICRKEAMKLRSWGFNKVIITAILACIAGFAPVALAAPLTFNVDGVITASNNQPLEAAAVSFRIDVKNATATCLLYREDFVVNMTSSNGYFS